MLVLVGVKDSEIIEQMSQAFNICFPGCEIKKASSGKQCMTAIKRNMPDLMIVDSYLADMDGSCLVERIRHFSTVPVLMFSYIKDEYLMTKALESGVDEYMVKPFRQMEFIARVRTLLRNRLPGSAGGNQGTGVFRALPPV